MFGKESGGEKIEDKICLFREQLKFYVRYLEKGWVQGSRFEKRFN